MFSKHETNEDVENEDATNDLDNLDEKQEESHVSDLCSIQDNSLRNEDGYDNRNELSYFEKIVDFASSTYVKKPIRNICIPFIIIFSFVFILIFTGNTNANDESDYDWAVNEDKYVKNLDMLSNLEDRSDILISSSQKKTRSVSLDEINMIISYEGPKNNDIFTPDNLFSMCQVERNWFLDKKYTKFCTLDNHQSNVTICESARESIVSIFYGYTNNDGQFPEECYLLNVEIVNKIAQEFYYNLSLIDGDLKYGFFAGKDYNSKGYTRRTRSLLKVGGPLKSFTLTLDDATNDQTSQTKKYYHFFKRIERKLIHFFNMKSSFLNSALRDESILGNLDVIWYNRLLAFDIFSDIVNEDMIVVSFSVIIVWIFMNIHTKSCFIASIGMLQIILSLPFARVFYSLVGQVHYFSTMQLLVIFLVLGIGADDVFVLTDAWKQSQDDVPRNVGEDLDNWLKRRMMSSYGRTMQAVFNTSFTTAMAFISTAISPVMPIAAFGIYATLCIVVNYLFIITLTPPCLILHHKYFGGFGPEGWCWANQCRFKMSPPPVTPPPSPTTPPPSPTTPPSSPTTSPPSPTTSPPFVLSQNDMELRQVEEALECPRLNSDVEFELKVNENTPYIARFLINLFEFEIPCSCYFKIQKCKICAICAILINASLTSYFMFKASKLDLPIDPEQWFPSDHMYERYQDVNSRFLLGDSGEYATMSLVWGTNKKLDRSKFNRWIPDKRRGTVGLDKNFDISNPNALTVISNACAQLRAKPCNKKACRPFGTLVQPDSVICPVDEFDVWYYQQYNSSIYQQQNRSLFIDRLNNFRETTSPKQYPSRSWRDLIGFVKQEPKFLVVEATMTIDFEVTNSELNGVLSVSEDFMKSLESTSSAKKVFLASLILSWFATQNALLRGMFIGLSIAFPVAFATLIFATKNIIISFYAIITIGMIVGSVLGCAALEGWALGISESIVTVIVVGFSVDYTIHLGHMYDHAGKLELNHLLKQKSHFVMNSREERSRYALMKMGSTVVAGAITTFGAGISMFFCQFTFFNKMAFLICVTIAFSLLYSLFFFVPLLYVMGPTGQVGALDWSKLSYCKERRDSPVPGL